MRDVWRNGTLTTGDRKQLRRMLRAQFSPRLRHEAASALAAWDAWLAGDSSLSALAVFLIAAHHGKVRTVLRGTQDNDELFGLRGSDLLQPVVGFFANEVTLSFDAKHLGAHGEWDESEATFSLTAPSWTEVLAGLVGTGAPDSSLQGDAIPEHEARNLGPFALAYLEAILVSADIRASKRPGKAKEARYWREY